MGAVAAAGSDGSSAAAADADAVEPKDASSTDGQQRSGRFFSYVSRLFGYPSVQPAPAVVTVPHVQRVHRPIKISPVIVIKPEHHHPYPLPHPPVVIPPHPCTVRQTDREEGRGRRIGEEAQIEGERHDFWLLRALAMHLRNAK